MIQEDKDLESFKTCFENCPNITSINVALARCNSPTKNMCRLAWRDALEKPWGDEPERCGVRQLSSVLLAAEHAGLNLKYLYAGSISYLFFDQAKKTMNKVAAAIRSLRGLTFVFHWLDQDDYANFDIFLDEEELNSRSLIGMCPSFCGTPPNSDILV